MPNSTPHKLPATIQFEQTQIEVYDHHGQPWFTGVQLSKALGFSSQKSVANIYNRNKDEFTNEMTESINSRLSGNLNKTVRIFSLRGCHMIAVFARTKKAKAFRVWVLDVLEQEVKKEKSAGTVDVHRLLADLSRCGYLSEKFSRHLALRAAGLSISDLARVTRVGKDTISRIDKVLKSSGCQSTAALPHPTTLFREVN